jgi:hypothetical protein
VRLEVSEQLRIHVQLEQIVKSAIDAVEIHPAAIERKVIRAARRVGFLGSFHLRPRPEV